MGWLPEISLKPSKIIESFKGRTKALSLSGDAKKYAEAIMELHNKFYILGKSGPFSLETSYVNIKLKEQPRNILRMSTEELIKWEKRYKKEQKIEHERVDAVELINEHPQLIILGKPGSGKTTFLKHLALQSLKGGLKVKRLPVYIPVKNWLDSEHDSLIDFMVSDFEVYYGFPGARKFIEDTLHNGQVLFLLDSMDEASASPGFNRMQKQLSEFVEMYDNNRFVISCRRGAYNQYFTGFVESELCDFEDGQVAAFSQLWFGKDNGEQFLTELRKEDNTPAQELARTPLSLNLLCLAYERDNKLPTTHAELYEKGLGALLKSWDENKRTDYSKTYHTLDVADKKNLFSRLAWSWYKADRCLVPEQEVKESIASYLGDLPGAREEALILDSKGALNAIETQHGILIQKKKGAYAFSNFSLQEFYSALYLKENLDIIYEILLQLDKRRWREVFLFISSMLSQKNTDRLLLLMQTQIKALMRQNPKIIKIVSWAAQKANSVQSACHPIALRTFYLDLARDLNLERALKRANILDEALLPSKDSGLDDKLDLDRGLDSDLAQARLLALTIARDINNDLNLARDRALERDLEYACARAIPFFIDLDRVDLDNAIKKAQELKLEDLQKALNELKSQQPGKKSHWRDWQSWAEDLRRIMLKYRDLGHDFELSEKESGLLTDCLYVNKLIIDCMQDSRVSSEVKEQITRTLLTPD